MSKRRPDPENPELTQAFFDVARPAREVFGEAFVETARRVRGKQRAPTKQLISLRLAADVLTRYRATGRGWQARMGADLARASKRLKRA